MEDSLNTWVLIDRAEQRDAAQHIPNARLRAWPPYNEALVAQDASAGTSRRSRLHSRATLSSALSTAEHAGSTSDLGTASAPPPDKTWIASVVGEWLHVLYSEVRGPLEPLLGCVRQVLYDDILNSTCDAERQYHNSLALPSLRKATVEMAEEKLRPEVFEMYRGVLDKMEDYYCPRNPLRRLLCDSWMWWWTGPPDIVYPLALECFVEQPSPCCAAASAAGSVNMLLRRPRHNYVDDPIGGENGSGHANGNGRSSVEVFAPTTITREKPAPVPTPTSPAPVSSASSTSSSFARRNSSDRLRTTHVAQLTASQRSATVGNARIDPAHCAALAKFSPFQAADAVSVMDRELMAMTLKSAVMAGLELTYAQIEEAANLAGVGMSPGGSFYFPPPTHKAQQKATLEGIRDIFIAMDTKDRAVFEKLTWTEQGGRPACGIAMKNVYLFIRDVWGLGKLRCHKPSTARFGSWGVQMVVEKLSEKFNLNLSAATQCLTDYSWPEFRQLLGRSGVAVVLHLPNHYAVVFGIKGSAVITARKGQPPTDLIAWDELHGIQSKRQEGMLILTYPTASPPPLKYFAKMTTSFSGGGNGNAGSASTFGSGVNGGKFAPSTPGGYTGPASAAKRTATNGGGNGTTGGAQGHAATSAGTSERRNLSKSPKSAAKAAKIHPRPRRPSSTTPASMMF